MHFLHDEIWRFQRFHWWCDSTSHFKDKLTEVSIMARRCPTLREKSGQRTKASCSPYAFRHSLGWWQLTARWTILSVYSCLVTDKHNILDKWSKPHCLAPWQSKSTVTFAKLSFTWLTWANSFPNTPPKYLKNITCIWKSGKAVEKFSSVSCITAWFTRVRIFRTGH